MDRATSLFWCGAAGLLAIAVAAALESPVPVAWPSPRAVAAPQPEPTSARLGGAAPAQARLPSQLNAVHSAERSWEARVDAFRQQSRLIADRGGSPEHVAAALKGLRDSHFSPDEQVLLDKYLAPAVPTLTRQ
jgi:hypothetical protein